MKKGQTYIIVTEQMFSDQETCQIFKLCLYFVSRLKANKILHDFWYRISSKQNQQLIVFFEWQLENKFPMKALQTDKQTQCFIE